MNSYYAAAERLGIDVRVRRRGRRRSISSTARFDSAHGAHRRPATATSARRAVVLAAGGFEANLEWLREIWGDAADNFIVRGTPLQQGHACCRLMLDAGAAAGRRSARSATRSPSTPARRSSTAASSRGSTACRSASSSTRTASGSTTRARTSGRSATRSGARLVAQQPDQIAYSIVDAKAVGAFMPSVFPPIVGRLDPRARGAARPAAGHARRDGRARSIAAVRPGTFDHAVLDDCRTEGLPPDKTHWAQRARHAAVLGLSAAAGHHVHLSRREGGRARARADDRAASRAANIFAAGEIMAGNILRQGLHRRRRHDDRHGVRPDRRQRRRRAHASRDDLIRARRST